MKSSLGLLEKLHDAGIGTVYQDLALNALTSVTRNFFLGNELKKVQDHLGILDFKGYG
jgi:simple sugar transport system ATP-binding protein